MSHIKKEEELKSEILSVKGEIKRLEDKIQEEKSKNAQLSLAKVDLEAKVHCLEKELRKATQTAPKTPTPPPTIQTANRSEDQSEDPSDG